ncbi:PREDICTED: testis-expressed sequence 36 protein [Mesitornis unicolor]|uniref:testis-expressed sequence 36 protein n=1 Tax=Mesitornis unicolor TaxID=54374 RepID=UPI0005281B54|nr:PREDICTED: testis-expressed sequence 36 protein [Mesitornis unicolor]
MPKDRGAPRDQGRSNAWFAHAEVCQTPPESTTRAAQKQVHDSGAAQYIKDKVPPAYKAREQKAVSNNFPFSSHDNRNSLQNVGEYFDFDLGRRKVEPERRQQNSQNFFQWAHAAAPSREDGLTIYQTSFMKSQNTESPFGQQKHCADKPVPENEKNLQPKK